MKSYKDLDIYKESKQLAIEVHKLSLMLPKFELYEEGAQIRRSSKAITSLICEGYGRGRYKGEFIKYLVMHMPNVRKQWFTWSFCLKRILLLTKASICL
ncbi:MAG: four helix bundle protein [Flavihumibacter sp.]|nr:four helix bundle protein [Flavihumibacter sp.]